MKRRQNCDTWIHLYSPGLTDSAAYTQEKNDLILSGALVGSALEAKRESFAARRSKQKRPATIARHGPFDSNAGRDLRSRPGARFLHIPHYFDKSTWVYP